jgi:hypothetical protein
MIEQPDLRPINGKEYLLYDDFIHEWKEPDGRRCRQITYKGFVTDIASTPDVCAPLGYKPDGLHRYAALGHDRRYQRRGLMTGFDILGPYQEFDPIREEWMDKDRQFSRKECDIRFLEDMLACGTTPLKAKTMYFAVRIFGRLAW